MRLGCHLEYFRSYPSLAEFCYSGSLSYRGIVLFIVMAVNFNPLQGAKVPSAPFPLELQFPNHSPFSYSSPALVSLDHLWPPFLNAL